MKNSIALKILKSTLWIIMIFGTLSSCSKDEEFLDANNHQLPEETIIIKNNANTTASGEKVSGTTAYVEVADCGSLNLISKPNLKMIHLEYTSSEDVENAIVKITMPQIISFVNGPASQGFIFTPNNPEKPTVVTWEGNLIGCVKKTFCIIVEPDCNPSGKAIIWSDFKVNGVSKKGTNKNKVFECN